MSLVASTDTSDETTQHNMPWVLRHDLTKHFVCYLESSFLGIEGERSANIALWLSERVAETLGHRTDAVVPLLSEYLQREFDMSSQGWQFTRPRVSPSRLRYVVLFNQSIWSLSLQCQLYALIAKHGGAIGEKDRDVLVSAFTASEPLSNAPMYASKLASS